MSLADWIIYSTVAAIAVLLGLWLRKVGRKPAEERVEALALGFGWIGFAIVAFTRAAA